MVHDFPDTATFLSEQDRARVIRRLKEDQQSSAEHEEFKIAYFWAAVTDWKMYLGMFIYSEYFLAHFTSPLPQWMSFYTVILHHGAGVEHTASFWRLSSFFGSVLTLNFHSGSRHATLRLLTLPSNYCEANGIHRQHGSAPVGSPIRVRSRSHYRHRIHCRSNQAAGTVQHFRLRPRYCRVRDATRLSEATHQICRHLPRSSRYLPVYR